MKLAHLRTPDGPRLSAATQDGWLDIARLVGDEDQRALSRVLELRGGLERVRELLGDRAAPDTLPEGDLGALLDRPGRIFCVGRNYFDHAQEMGSSGESPWPETFLRLGSGVTGPTDDIPAPSVSVKLDFEGELGVVIGSPGRHVAAAEAESLIAGFCVCNDVTARDWQQRGRQFTPGKNFDGTLPVGPALVTPDEVDWRNLALTTQLNGETMQSANTSQLIFDIPAVIEFLSSFTMLEPGDLICTGTPGGVGIARTPPVHLGPGDVVQITVEGVGTIRNRFVEDGQTPATDRWLREAQAGK